MATSDLDLATRLANLLPEKRAANLGALIARLGVSESDLHDAAQGLVGSGVAEWRGRRRLARVSAGDPTFSPEFPSVVSQLGEAARRIWRALPSDGSRVSNARLRSLPELQNLDDNAYPAAKQELVHAGVVRAGVGRSGTLARTVGDEPESEPSPSPAVDLERELYLPFARWYKSTLEGGNLAFAEVEVTATARGRLRGSGKWSRPDVTAVTVNNYELLPGASLEVASFEIKRSVDASRLESVYEAAAHGRWAHRANLVLERGRNVALFEPEILEEAERFSLGVWEMHQPPNGPWEIKELREARRREPDPADLDELLEYFLGRFTKAVRQSYVRSIK